MALNGSGGFITLSFYNMTQKIMKKVLTNCAVAN